MASYLSTYIFNNGKIYIPVRTDYVKSVFSQKRDFVKTKVIFSEIKVEGEYCEKLQKLSKNKLRIMVFISKFLWGIFQKEKEKERFGNLLVED